MSCTNLLWSFERCCNAIESYHPKRVLLLFGIAVTLFSVSSTTFAGRLETYRVTHLCTVCNVTAMNNEGELVGSRSVDGVSWRAFIWRRDHLIDLSPALMDSNHAFAHGINDRSEVVGYFDHPETFERRAFLWRRGEVSLIDVAPGRPAMSASQINNRGEMLVGVVDPQGEYIETIVWRKRDGRITQLEPLPGTPPNLTDPIRMNNRGAVIGSGYGGPAGTLPLLWERGTVMQIQLPDGADGANTWAINDHGVVVGVAIYAERWAAYRWRRGHATELASLPNANNSEVFDINDDGLMVGHSYFADDQRIVATLWLKRGQALELSSLIADDDPLKPFLTLDSASLINERGEIVVYASDSRTGEQGRYLLVPTNCSGQQ